jgi:hypothetical protein
LTITETAARPKSPGAGRIELTRLSISTFALIAMGALVVGVVVGGVTGNSSFLFLMSGLPIVAIFGYAIAEREIPPTRPTRGDTSSVLPIVALVLACAGTTIVAIALAHASRHLISARGGDGEKIALAALIVGYATLAVQVSAGLWVLTFLAQLPK